MTFHIQKREPNGIMRGLFLSDERDPEKQIVYSSEFAQIVETEDGTFLKMDRGTIQQQRPRTDLPEGEDDGSPDFSSVNIINFDTYAIDLTKFTGVDDSRPRHFKPRERSTEALLKWDDDDPFYETQIDNSRAELHDRFTNPLYNLVFATVVCAFLAQVRTTRERRGHAIIVAILIASAIRLAGFAATSMAIQTPLAVPFMYALPLGTSTVAFWVAVTGRRITLVDNLIRSMELLNDRILNMLNRLRRKQESPNTI
ncbi:LptF/LptG family permease [uncultured Cohaesibacter sp.]|uniref:LptF/LptG family permease n=1 Tax=uncultured Cohaesibacter sp. TaxID=1002546 RepID=UPI0029C64FCC|nr:LptF/LptG family permease [uncultured Cohaesibacter sp.]